MELFNNLVFGFSVALTLQNCWYCFIGVLARHADRRAARHRAARHHRDAAADHLQPAADRGADHAGRHLLRRAVRRLDHGDPGQSARAKPSSVVTCIDGYQMARQGRAGPALAIAAHRLVLRRHGVHAASSRSFGPPLAELALKFGAPEYFSLMLMGLVAAAVLAQRRHGQGDRDDRAGTAAGHRRHRRQLRHGALQLRHPGADRRHRLRRRSPWACSAIGEIIGNLGRHGGARRSSPSKIRA